MELFVEGQLLTINKKSLLAQGLFYYIETVDVLVHFIRHNEHKLRDACIERFFVDEAFHQVCAVHLSQL